MTRRLETLFTEVVRIRPDAPAVYFGRSVYSYGDIDNRANQIGQKLRQMGVGPGDRVGVWMEKSAAAVAAMQAVLRLSACYVPLDPLASMARTHDVICNAELRAIVTTPSRKVRGLPQDLAHIQILAVRVRSSDPETDDLSGVPPTQLPVDPQASDEDLAYILYTSGSTGMPKGVCIRHRNARAFIDWSARELGAQSSDRFASHAPFHFDLSILDLYVAFAVGASVTLIPETLAYAPELLVDLVATQKITTWYSVPSALVLMMERGRLLSRNDLQLRTIIFAGEVFPMASLRALRERFAAARLLNLYGPTETNVCTYYEVPRAIDPQDTSIPIGIACSEDQAVAMQDDGTPAGIGQVGELIVSGGSVMLGYFGQPPLGDHPYRTGDLVRVRPDGGFDFLGRRDHQAKVRGQRVELGAIEAAMLSCAHVLEAVVAVCGTGPSARLCAFVVVREGHLLSLLEARRLCAERLPRSMMIDELEILGEMPRTSSGKADRSELVRKYMTKQSDATDVAKARSQTDDVHS
jgi:amino acid adenylation domain-containing protein